jgi:hypothetical protein
MHVGMATIFQNPVFSYAGMPWDEAERNLRLFAAEVMPALTRLGADAPAARTA